MEDGGRGQGGAYGGLKERKRWRSKRGCRIWRRMLCEGVGLGEVCEGRRGGETEEMRGRERRDGEE